MTNTNNKSKVILYKEEIIQIEEIFIDAFKSFWKT